MTVFQTPEPISVSIEFGVGDLRLVASESAETVVEVKPTDPTKKGDVTAAMQTQVEYASGSLLVRGPKTWRKWTPWGSHESIDVEIQLPPGSRVGADLGMAAVHSTGRLGDLDLKTGMGDVRVDEAGPVKIRTGFGEVTLGQVERRRRRQDRIRPDRHRLGRGDGDGQELQRRHPHRGGKRPSAAAQCQRRHPGRQGGLSCHGQDRGRRRAPGNVVARRHRSHHRLRPDRHRSSRWGRRLARPLYRLRPGQ